MNFEVAMKSRFQQWVEPVRTSLNFTIMITLTQEFAVLFSYFLLSLDINPFRNCPCYLVYFALLSSKPIWTSAFLVARNLADMTIVTHSAPLYFHIMHKNYRGTCWNIKFFCYIIHHELSRIFSWCTWWIVSNCLIYFIIVLFVLLLYAWRANYMQSWSRISC